MDDRFFNGIIGAKTKVCGHELKSLTAWHYILLQAIESPVLANKGDAHVSDVLIFLKVVSCEWPNAPKLRPKFTDVWWAWRMKNPRVARKQMALLSEWIDAQLSAPRFWESEDKSESKLSSPPVFALIVGLVSKGNLCLSEAWNMRMAEARWFDATLAELNGADLKIAYEGESEAVASILEDMTEERKIEVARQNLAPEAFEVWLENRKAKQSD